MNKKNLTLLISATALFLSISTQAEIYKWTDAKGTTHYTATPPPQKTLKNKTKAKNIEVQILSAAGKFRPAVSESETNSNSKAAKSKNKQADNKLSPPDKKLINYCKQQRKNLSNLKSNFRNVWVDPDGKKTTLDQKQRQEKVNFLIEKISENCKGV